MKTKLTIKIILLAIITVLGSFIATGQLKYIPDVPDLNQPILPWWGLLPDNACAPVAAANICIYWDDVKNHGNAVDLNSRVAPDSVPAFLYYWMDTHDLGDPTRANNNTYPYRPGTYTIDIAPGLSDYVRWDSLHPFSTPAPQMPIPPDKMGYDWTIITDEVVGFDFHKTEIDSGRPDLVVFTYWNPDSTNAFIKDSVSGDTIRFMTWDVPISMSEPPHPHEDWFFETKDESIGHAVTGVGYLENYDPDSTGPIPHLNWIICHDNWKYSPENIAIPWQEWVATISADPGKDTLKPVLFCTDTTIYLDNNGQFSIDKSYVLDSAWDNTGIDTIILSNYSFICNSGGPEVFVQVCAFDIDGNVGQCNAMVTVLDTISPVGTCSDTTVYLDAGGQFLIDSSYVLKAFSDNCQVDSVSLSESLFTEEDIGTPQTVIVTVYDGWGNSTQCTASVNVYDTMPTNIYRKSISDVLLIQNIKPNPFKHSAEISFRVFQPGNVSITIFDLKGRQIEELVNKYHCKGIYNMKWTPASAVKGGIYLCNIKTNTSEQSIKLIYIK